MIPFLGHRDGAETVAMRRGATYTASQLLGDALALSERMPAREYVINLCRDRYRFAVALAAAMLRRQVTLLPPSQSPEALKELASAYGSPYLLIDDDEIRELESVRVHCGAGSIHYAPEKLAFSEDMTAVIAFTSGSTGRPLPNVKLWGPLAAGGSTEAARFALLPDRPVVVVGTVPPQHMYGLETTVVMPLRAGLTMHGDRPFFPEDVRAILSAIDADRVLISTPVHLRALMASETSLPPLRLVVCATAPLAQDLARGFEERFDVEVHEVYGFTEAGMVATRRTVNGPAWHLLDGLCMRRVGDEVRVGGGHVPMEVAFTDLINTIDAQHFELLGRTTDLVNIAGKRTSISYLDHLLCAVEGVEDGAFFMPDEKSDGVTRLIAFAVAPGRTREYVLQMLAKRVDPVFLPRPLYLVDQLPRNATGKLPHDQLGKLARQCATLGERKDVTVYRLVDPSHPALPGHFPGDPVIPGVVLLDTVVDTAASEYGLDAEQLSVNIRSAKFLRPVRPGEPFRIKLTPGASHTVRFECSVGEETAVTGVMEAGGASAQ